jgi:radical SAM protein with 4Fe4S-binding SPASM domain
MRRPVVWGLPSVVSIEPTNLCNLKCPECPSGTGKLTRPLGVMKPVSFKKIIDGIKDSAFYVQLFLQGEPYINKELPEMIRYAHENKIYIAVSTNGLLINRNNITKLLENAPDKLIFSMDGTDEETYRMYRVGGDFNKALENLKLLIEEKRRLNLSKPYIELQFLVMKQNENQIGHLKGMAQSLGVDQLTLKTMQVYSYESAVKFLPENKKYSRYEIKDNQLIIKNELKNQCLALWRTAVITWDLKLVPCCFDKDGKYELGSLNDNTISEIWKSEKYTAFRQRILNNRKSIDICTNCTEGMSENI